MRAEPDVLPRHRGGEQRRRRADVPPDNRRRAGDVGGARARARPRRGQARREIGPAGPAPVATGRDLRLDHAPEVFPPDARCAVRRGDVRTRGIHAGVHFVDSVRTEPHDNVEIPGDFPCGSGRRYEILFLDRANRYCRRADDYARPSFSACSCPPLLPRWTLRSCHVGGQYFADWEVGRRTSLCRDVGETSGVVVNLPVADRASILQLCWHLGDCSILGVPPPPDPAKIAGRTLRRRSNGRGRGPNEYLCCGISYGTYDSVTISRWSWAYLMR